MALKFVSVVRLQFRSGELRVCGMTFFREKVKVSIKNFNGKPGLGTADTDPVFVYIFIEVFDKNRLSHESVFSL